MELHFVGFLLTLLAAAGFVTLAIAREEVARRQTWTVTKSTTDPWR